jgi:hypothetical protein
LGDLVIRGTTVLVCLLFQPNSWKKICLYIAYSYKFDLHHNLKFAVYIYSIFCLCCTLPLGSSVISIKWFFWGFVDYSIYGIFASLWDHFELYM